MTDVIIAPNYSLDITEDLIQSKILYAIERGKNEILMIYKKSDTKKINQLKEVITSLNYNLDKINESNYGWDTYFLYRITW